MSVVDSKSDGNYYNDLVCGFHSINGNSGIIFIADCDCGFLVQLRPNSQEVMKTYENLKSVIDEYIKKMEAINEKRCKFLEEEMRLVNKECRLYQRLLHNISIIDGFGYDLTESKDGPYVPYEDIEE